MPSFPLRLTDSSYSQCSGDAKSGEVVQDRRTDLDLRDLPIKVARGEALT